MTHTLLALAVWTHALLYLGKIWKSRERLTSIVPSAIAVAVASTAQIVLGIVAFIFLLPFDGTPRPVSFYQAVVRTCHQTNGALLLAATIVLVLRTFRQLSGSVMVRKTELVGATSRPSALDWEGAT
jgi:cytochrome c oxidase assembly protein subunit 15